MTSHLSSRRGGGVAWVLIVLVTAGSVVAERSQEAAFRSWARRRLPVLPPESANRWTVEHWTIWPAWVRSLRDASGWVQQESRIGLLVGGAGLGWLGWRRRGVGAASPALRRARPGPGRVAGGICLATLAFGTCVAVQHEFVDPHWLPLAGPTQATTPSIYWTNLGWGGTNWTPEAIAVAWIWLASTRRWRRSPEDGVERLGRWFGWAWIALDATAASFQVVGVPWSW